jgi:ABC-type lipoprotein release transport system permease subunit
MVEATSLLAAAGLVAAIVPAWRAARIRLDEALRCE